jgi:hypothetical protein
MLGPGRAIVRAFTACSRLDAWTDPPRTWSLSYRSGRSLDWRKINNPESEAVRGRWKRIGHAEEQRRRCVARTRDAVEIGTIP